MTNKVISIIIATYNADKVLDVCLKSIIPQLSKEIELIMIDGGSSDNTVKIIKNNRQFIEYTISEPDNGIYDAWNKGIEKSKGEWIMFIGADDELLPNSLIEYLNLIQTKDLTLFDYISAQNEYINNDNKLIKLLGNGAEWKLMRRGMSAAHVGSLHNKKNLFNKVGHYNLDFKLCADYELLLRKKDNLKSYFLPRRISNMKVGGMSFSTNAIKESYEIRKTHNSVSPILNKILFCRDVLAFKLFKFRKSI